MSKEGFLEETDKHRGMLELGGPSGPPFPFSAFSSRVLRRAVTMKGPRGSVRALGSRKSPQVGVTA